MFNKKFRCELCGRKKEFLEKVRYDNKDSFVCESCYFAYDEKQHKGQEQRNFVTNTDVSNFKEFHNRIDNFELELSIIKKANERFFYDSSRPILHSIRNLKKCASCMNYVKKNHRITHFYKKEYVCSDCWRNFIDYVSKQKIDGISLFCTYCKKQFLNYEQYYNHHFEPSHLN